MASSEGMPVLDVTAICWWPSCWWEENSKCHFLLWQIRFSLLVASINMTNDLAAETGITHICTKWKRKYDWYRQASSCHRREMRCLLIRRDKELIDWRSSLPQIQKHFLGCPLSVRCRLLHESEDLLSSTQKLLATLSHCLEHRAHFSEAS